MLRRLKNEDSLLISNVLQPREIELFKNTYLSGLATWYAFGWFKDNKLVGISTAHYNGDAHEWFLLKQHADQGNDMEEMVHAVCKKFESNGLYRFFWLDADYYVDDMKNFIPSYYHHYKEYSTDPYGLPKYLRHFNILMGNNQFPITTHVYMSIVPNDYRNS